MSQFISLRDALGGMANIPQFFIWRLTWSPEDGKYAKTPCGIDGSVYPRSAADPGLWMTFDAAMQTVTHLRQVHTAQHPALTYTLGFYLTAETGYWFLDVDKAIDAAGQWSAKAQHIWASLPGAAFEFSSSGTGFHLFGRGELPIDRQIKPSDSGLELYHQGRGIAFGLRGDGMGSADVDHGVAMRDVIVPHYFAPLVVNGVMVPEVGPRADWRGPVDDDDLLTRARRSQSKASMFNVNKATFADLFDGNWEVLHRAYQDGDGSFAASEADYALASQLAFWTGCDADRMERLMRQSALYREKWDTHRTYLRDLTIARVRARTMNVLQDKLPEALGVTTSDEPVAAFGALMEGKTFVNAKEQQEIFKGCVYVVDESRIFVPMPQGGFMFMGSEQFTVWFGQYQFVLDKENSVMAKTAYEAFTRSKAVLHDRVQHTLFRPDLEPGSVFNMGGVSYVNTYMPMPVRRVQGDATPFLKHVAMMLPNQRDQMILVSYMAACVQHIGHKFQWCPVLQGLPGNGKSLMATCVMKAIGESFCHTPVAADLAGKFNDWIYEKLFIGVNDMVVPRGRDEVIETIKPLITERQLNIEGKGVKKRMRNVCANFMFSMNKRDGVRKEKGERRFAIFFTAQQEEGDMEATGMTQKYLAGLKRWFEGDGFAIVADYLTTFQIAAEFSPIGEMVYAPVTSSEDAVKVEARGSLEAEILAAVEEGRQGFNGGYICWQHVMAICEEMFRGRMPKQRVEETLLKIGYLPHPKLGPKGLTNNRVASEGGRQIRIYATANHPTINDTMYVHQTVVNDYVSKQNQFTGGFVPQIVSNNP